MNSILLWKWVHDASVELATTVCSADRRVNERHPHHRFSCLMQAHEVSLGLDASEPLLHPEWPTYKQHTGIEYARYKRRDLPSMWEYHVDDRGGAGYLDFAIGPYNEPLIGVEMILKRGWVHEEVVFDLMKLLHSRIPFQFAAFINVILAPEGHVFRGTRSAEALIPAAYETAMSRLTEAGVGAGVRHLLALFVEVRGSTDRCVWRLTGDGQAEKLPLSKLMTSECTVVIESHARTSLTWQNQQSYRWLTHQLLKIRRSVLLNSDKPGIAPQGLLQSNEIERR